MLKFLVDEYEIHLETAVAAQYRITTSRTSYEVVSLVKKAIDADWESCSTLVFNMQICALRHFTALAVYFPGHLSWPVYFQFLPVEGIQGSQVMLRK